MKLFDTDFLSCRCEVLVIVTATINRKSFMKFFNTNPDHYKSINCSLTMHHTSKNS